MERSNHRVRNLPTDTLVAELVVALVDAMQRQDLAPCVTQRQQRIFRELSSRYIPDAPPVFACTCSDCLGDFHPGEIGPGPFDTTS